MICSRDVVDMQEYPKEREIFGGLKKNKKNRQREEDIPPGTHRLLLLFIEWVVLTTFIK